MVLGVVVRAGVDLGVVVDQALLGGHQAPAVARTATRAIAVVLLGYG